MFLCVCMSLRWLSRFHVALRWQPATVENEVTDNKKRAELSRAGTVRRKTGDKTETCPGNMSDFGGLFSREPRWKCTCTINAMWGVYKQRATEHWLAERRPPEGLLTHIKNCEPLVSLPRFAMDSRNSLLCFIEKLSSAKTREGRNKTDAPLRLWSVTISDYKNKNTYCRLSEWDQGCVRIRSWHDYSQLKFSFNAVVKYISWLTVRFLLWKELKRKKDGDIPGTHINDRVKKLWPPWCWSSSHPCVLFR